MASKDLQFLKEAITQSGKNQHYQKGAEYTRWKISSAFQTNFFNWSGYLYQKQKHSHFWKFYESISFDRLVQCGFMAPRPSSFNGPVLFEVVVLWSTIQLHRSWCTCHQSYSFEAYTTMSNKNYSATAICSRHSCRVTWKFYNREEPELFYFSFDILCQILLNEIQNKIILTCLILQAFLKMSDNLYICISPETNRWVNQNYVLRRKRLKFKLFMQNTVQV